MQVDETVASIKAVPDNAQAAAKQKADDLVAYIKSIPDTIAGAAKVRSIRWLCSHKRKEDTGTWGRITSEPQEAAAVRHAMCLR